MLYKYDHSCGLENQRLFLPNETADAKVLKCFRCGRGVTAHAVRDKAMAITAEKDGIRGIARHDER